MLRVLKYYIQPMNPLKVLKDYMGRSIAGAGFVPRGLLDLNEYFRHNGPIVFKFHNENGFIVAVSENFRHGSIITQARNLNELDKNIKDAILTTFEIPSSYAAEAKIRNEKEKEYALA